MAPPQPAFRVRLQRLVFPLRGRRVDLVLPDPRHIPRIVSLINEPSVARWTLHIPYPYTARDAREWIRRSARRRRAGEGIALSIVRRSDGEYLGGVGLHQVVDGAARAEVGYWLGSEFRGQGYASEAVNLLLRTAFTRLGLHRIEARVFPGNHTSTRLARRCGFRLEGRLRDEVQKDGRWRTTLLFSRLSSDKPPGL